MTANGERRHPGDPLGEWAQSMRSKGDGAKVIDLLRAIDDWMVVCHQQESEIERLEARLDEAQLLYIEASNPGIDMDEVRRMRARQNGGSGSS
jgi:hypothetical protein